MLYWGSMLDVRWESQGYFKPKFDKGSDPFVISMPPPNVTGSLHMGHAMFVTLEVWQKFIDFGLASVSFYQFPLRGFAYNVCFLLIFLWILFKSFKMVI